MKRFALLSYLLIASLMLSHGQANIFSISMSPLQPTEMDTITFTVIKSMDSGPYHKSLSSWVQGSIINASIEHCFDNYATEELEYDEFKVGPFVSGNYVFKLTTYDGFGAVPWICTPGAKPDDTMSVNFEVTKLTGISANYKNKDLLKIYPNPSDGRVFIQAGKDLTGEGEKKIQIISLEGKVVSAYKIGLANTTEITLLRGIYYLQLFDNEELLTTKRIVVVK